MNELPIGFSWPFFQTNCNVMSRGDSSLAYNHILSSDSCHGCCPWNGQEARGIPVYDEHMVQYMYGISELDNNMHSSNA